MEEEAKYAAFSQLREGGQGKALIMIFLYLQEFERSGNQILPGGV